MINMSIGLGVVPSFWRIITPVPKCTPVNNAGDLRPISVTPILSRMVDRLIVKVHIFPSILTEELFNQYGFKKTSNTTAAIIDITHKISMLLETNKFVRCLLIDFSKAFDSVDHIIFINKLKLLNISDNVIQWVVSFLKDRMQFVKMGQKWSFTSSLIDLLCRVLCSSIGPTLFVICIKLIVQIMLQSMLTMQV